MYLFTCLTMAGGSPTGDAAGDNEAPAAAPVPSTTTGAAGGATTAPTNADGAARPPRPRTSRMGRGRGADSVRERRPSQSFPPSGSPSSSSPSSCSPPRATRAMTTGTLVGGRRRRRRGHCLGRISAGCGVPAAGMYTLSLTIFTRGSGVAASAGGAGAAVVPAVSAGVPGRVSGARHFGPWAARREPAAAKAIARVAPAAAAARIGPARWIMTGAFLPVRGAFARHQ